MWCMKLRREVLSWWAVCKTTLRCCQFIGSNHQLGTFWIRRHWRHWYFADFQQIFIWVESTKLIDWYLGNKNIFWWPKMMGSALSKFHKLLKCQESIGCNLNFETLKLFLMRNVQLYMAWSSSWCDQGRLGMKDLNHSLDLIGFLQTLPQTSSDTSWELKRMFNWPPKP